MWYLHKEDDIKYKYKCNEYCFPGGSEERKDAQWASRAGPEMNRAMFSS